MRNVLALVLAGGKGSRLEPLTRDRAKPAVPFGGGYRIIDFTLSNCINSGLRRILILTQYKAASLDRHINLGWRFLCRELNEFVDFMKFEWLSIRKNVFALCRCNHCFREICLLVLSQTPSGPPPVRLLFVYVFIVV